MDWKNQLTKTRYLVLFIILGVFIAGTLSANPFADAVGGWKEAIADLQDQINALGGSQIYETSETVLIEAGTSGGVAFEISCLEGDWMNVSDNSDNSFPDVKAFSNQSVTINSLSYNLVKEPFSQITGAAGLVEIQAMQLFDVEVTLTILCFSPAT